MISLVSDTYNTCQCLELLPSLVRDNMFIIWKVVMGVILDVNPLHRFVILSTCLVLLQIKLCIPIVIIMKLSMEVPLYPSDLRMPCG